MGLITYENLEDGQKVTANVFNERFAQIVAQLNGNLDDTNIANYSISKAKLKAEVFESQYPVGSMYVNFTNNTNPATLLGFGVWQAVAGKFIAGYDGSQTEFNAAEKTGGHKELQAHTHTFKVNLQHSDGEPTGGESLTSGLQVNGRRRYTDTTDSTGGGNGQNLPPYIVGYVWKRIS